MLDGATVTSYDVLTDEHDSVSFSFSSLCTPAAGSMLQASALQLFLVTADGRVCASDLSSGRQAGALDISVSSGDCSGILGSSIDSNGIYVACSQFSYLIQYGLLT